MTFVEKWNDLGSIILSEVIQTQTREKNLLKHFAQNTIIISSDLHDN